MSTPMFTTRRNAIAACVKEMAAANQVSASTVRRHLLIKNHSCNCKCGESLAIKVIFAHPNFYGAERTEFTVGVCESCSKYTTLCM